MFGRRDRFSILCLYVYMFTELGEKAIGPETRQNVGNNLFYSKMFIVTALLGGQ